MRIHFKAAEFGVILTVKEAMPTRVALNIILLEASPTWTKFAFNFFNQSVIDKETTLSEELCMDSVN